jgi:hypothetical protein
MAEIRNDEADIAFHALQAISGAFRGLELSGPLMADAQRIDLAFQDCIGAIAHSAFVGFPDDPRRWGAAETILNGDAFFDPATWEQTEQWRRTKLDVEGQVLDAASASDSAVEAALSSALARTVRQRVDQFAKRLPGDRLTTPVRKRLIYAMVHCARNSQRHRASQWSRRPKQANPTARPKRPASERRRMRELSKFSTPNCGGGDWIGCSAESGSAFRQYGLAQGRSLRPKMLRLADVQIAFAGTSAANIPT